ncbi:2-C-methyl-D-erythritol 4-phosphate cytidylyltransferase [Rhodococcoides trifolii]|uniref:2-C-methyl-D-erythritol 4-phosphate cytidylyltransferase n=1 Tax=Rhodococcoides trifolii TaxID=908250 RepID=A0A917G1H3_9NOCA|nr:IspD/TarI family cytidylyltransferase [Rhodococcus trifolii]GGG18053.1 2-C-methyl-D-erythritol 4-phosphate cytidylyltransferase [Rhodococcus trifolii]
MISKSSPSAVGIVLAAGSGTRVGAKGNKAYLPLAGKKMVSWTLRMLSGASELDRLLLVVRHDEVDLARETVTADVPDIEVEIVVGGRSRHESEFNALTFLADDIRSGSIDVVLIHDAARPLAGPDMMSTAVSVAREFGGSLPAVPADDLVEIDDGAVRTDVLDRTLVRVQSPQAFRAPELLDAYIRSEADAFEGTDTSSCVEHYTDLDVRTFPGSSRNLKVTYAHDVVLAERLLSS